MGSVNFTDLLAEWDAEDRLEQAYRRRSPILWWFRYRVPVLWWATLRALGDAWRYPGAVWFRFKHGFWYSDVWSLDATIAKFALPRLRYLRTIAHGHPSDTTWDEWFWILHEIEWFLEAHTRDEGLWSLGKSNAARYERAGQLFGKYFGALWD